VAGALTERDFVTKLERARFTDIAIVERTPMGVDDCALYPLFTPDVLDLMRTLIPPQRQQTIGTAIVVRARLDRHDAAIENRRR
jgi:arsenite methyltransferase